MWDRLGNLSEESISDLNNYFEEQKPNLKVINKYGRINKIRLLRFDSVDHPDVLSSLLESYEIIDNKKLTPLISYILEYYEDSFAQMHMDDIGDDDGESLTTVTLLHKSDDLQGGEILLRDARKAITVLRQDVGEVISYDHRTWHGVARVLNGTRRVLINWYKTRE